MVGSRVNAHLAAKSGIHGIPALANTNADKGKVPIWNGAGWDMPGHPRVNGQNGFFAPTRSGWVGLDGTLTNQFVTGARFMAPMSLLVHRLAISVGVASSSAGDAVALSIFDAAGTTLLASTGSVTGRLNSTGIKAIALAADYQLVAGTVYYASFWSNYTGTPQFGKASMGGGFYPEFFGTTIGGSDLTTGQLGTWDGVGVAGGAAPPTTLAGAARQGSPVLIAVRSS